MEPFENEVRGVFGPVTADAPPEPTSYGVEFVTTAKGSHRAKIGPVETVPGEDGPVPKVVSQVLVSELYETAEGLGRDLTKTLAALAWDEVQLIGEVPEGFAFSPGAGAPPRAEPGIMPIPERLAEFDGSEIDRRKLGILAALDRKFEHFVDPRARRIWLQLYEGKTLPEAIERANHLGAGGAHAQLSDYEGAQLAQQEAYRLALYIVLVQNRDIGPPSSRLG